jgi:hypothetical protein
MSEWMSLVKKEMAKGLSLKDAMKAAKKHYHPKKTQKGGVLVRVGGKRRSTRKHRGGSLYGFGEAAGGPLHGGQGRMTPVPSVADNQMTVSAGSGGRRRRRSTRRHH